MTKLLSAAAILLAGIGYAAAQTSQSPTPDSGAKCWDQATQSVRDKNPQTGAAQAGRDAKTAGTNTTGSSGSKAATGPTGSSMGQRPAGMQNC